MAQKKDFKKNTSEYFFNPPEEKESPDYAKQFSEPDPVPIQADNYNLPRGLIAKKEPRSERIQLLVRKSTKELIKADADKAEKSLNEFVNDILEDYLRKGGK
jgi:hypothetical protein